MAAQEGSSEAWWRLALCNQMEVNPNIFFPEKGESLNQARRICNDCQVREACLDYAITNHITHGMWGGLSERERRQLLRVRRIMVRSHDGRFRK